MDEDKETFSEFTEDEKYANYCRLNSTMNDIIYHRTTPEWMTRHSELILQYRNWCSNYGRLYPDDDDTELRIKLSGIETFLNCLCAQIETYGKFNISVYYNLNDYFKFVVDYHNTTTEEDELVNLISGMKVTST